jgi:methanogenic corrinoid protein MtbC1
MGPPDGGVSYDDFAARRRHTPPALVIASLTRAIEQEVIPRLVLSGRPLVAPLAPVVAPPLNAADVADYACALVARDDTGAAEYMQQVTTRGFAAEAIYLDLLAPTARHLGQMWEQDLCDFTQVTIGVMRLQQVLRRLSPSFQDNATTTDLVRRALLIPVPGEQHTFGLVMVSEFFRRAGWDVWGNMSAPAIDAIDLVAGVAFQVIGFSVGSANTLDRLAATIRTVRRRSSNAEIGILVGGPIFVAQPELVALVGADATATDGRHAVQQAHALLAMQQMRA